MTPYYSDDLVALYHGDCLDVMAELDDASVDTVLTDPPYSSGGRRESPAALGAAGGWRHTVGALFWIVVVPGMWVAFLVWFGGRIGGVW